MFEQTVSLFDFRDLDQNGHGKLNYKLKTILLNIISNEPLTDITNSINNNMNILQLARIPNKI